MGGMGGCEREVEEGDDTCKYMADSLRCTAETNTTFVKQLYHNKKKKEASVQFSSAAQLCPILCDPKERPGSSYLSITAKAVSKDQLEAASSGQRGGNLRTNLHKSMDLKQYK